MDEKLFALDIRSVKKVIKQRGDSFKIEEIEQAPRYVLGISEVEITQNQKKLITFVDFKLLSAVNTFLEEYKPEDEEEKKEEDKKENSVEAVGEDEEFVIPRRFFIILSHPEKESFVGILVEKIHGIFEFEEGRNAYFYPPPNIKGVKDFFECVIIPYEESQFHGKRIFSVRTEKIFELSEIE